MGQTVAASWSEAVAYHGPSTDCHSRVAGFLKLDNAFMDGKGLARHVFVERLWRSVKYEEVYQRA